MKSNYIFISGYAKLPGGTTAAELYKVVAVGILVNKDTGEIMDADCSLVTTVAKEHVKGILIGKNINDIDVIEEELTERYFGSAKKALITGVKKCHDRYKQVLEKNDKE